MKRWTEKLCEFAVVVICVGGMAVLVRTREAAAQQAPAAMTPAQFLETYRDACVEIHKAVLREKLARAETETAIDKADAAHDAFVAASNAGPVVPPPAPAVTTPPAGAIVLVRGPGTVAVTGGATTSVHSGYLPETTKTAVTASVAWPGGSIDLKQSDLNGPWTVEASLDGRLPWAATRSGVFWVDGTVDGDYTVRLNAYSVAMGSADTANVLPTLTLTRTTSAGVATWTRKP